MASSKRPQNRQTQRLRKIIIKPKSGGYTKTSLFSPAKDQPPSTHAASRVLHSCTNNSRCDGSGGIGLTDYQFVEQIDKAMPMHLETRGGHWHSIEHWQRQKDCVQHAGVPPNSRPKPFNQTCDHSIQWGLQVKKQLQR